MRWRPKDVVLAGCLLLTSVTLLAGPQTVSSGVYTTEQAAAGEVLYYDQCAECHGDDLGGIERAPALIGGAFVDSWKGKPLRALLEQIENMPPDEPPVVAGTEAVEVLAFLLYAVGIPSGPTPLPADRARLGDIVFEPAEP
jgi:mono/diheme cytochrome c family protein